MKYIIILLSLSVFFGCTETPTDTPLDSLRDVVFSVDMNNYIDDGLFDAAYDYLRLKGDFNNWGSELIMTESRDEGIYSIELADLIAGRTYEYLYCINDSLETLDGTNRTYQVQATNNSVTNYYNELSPVIVTFRVNMTNQIDDGSFDPDADTVDVPGTHNDWSENTTMTETDNVGIYETSISTLEVGTEIEYKFRINFNWDTAEFDGGGNRQSVVGEGETVLEHWYNVED